MIVPISNDLISDFLHCRYKAHLRLAGESGIVSDYEKMQKRIDQEYRDTAVEHLLRLHPNATVCEGSPTLRECLESGPSLVIGGSIDESEIRCSFSALLRSNSASCSSKPEYLPIVFFPGERISIHARRILSFHGLALKRLLKTPAPLGKIIHGAKLVTSKVSLPKLIAAITRSAKDLSALRDAATAPPLRLIDHCSECEFRTRCYEKAVQNDDLSLLRGLSPKQISKLNNSGIFTVKQYSYTFRAPKAAKNDVHRPTKHQHPIQALAICTGKTYVAEEPKLPTPKTDLFLDIEGIPERGFTYLIGLLACKNGKEEYHSFWADEGQDEETMWNDFLLHMAEQNEYGLFHYGGFDAQSLRRLHRQYGGSPSVVEAIKSTSCNVLAAIYSNVYFPTYSNGLKNIARHLGFQWTDENASGLQSIVWRHNWEETREAFLKERLLTYNREDCCALRLVTRAIRGISALNSSCPISTLRDPGPTSYPHKQTFFFPELDHLNRCAYFDYQRSQVYVHTDSDVKKSLRRREIRSIRDNTVDKEIYCPPPNCCPQCGSDQLSKVLRRSKLVYDLKQMKHGIKKWTIRYIAHRWECEVCKMRFVPNGFESIRGSKYGHSLMAWTVYHKVALRSSNEVIAEQLWDVFGCSLESPVVQYLKVRAAMHYEATYRGLIERIRRGRLVHADETQVGVLKGKGYVWAFTNLEDVVYVYTDGRDGDIVKEVLKGFTGVLVSDFYAAYDSIGCVQQKCLIHLMRDINDSLFRNPFDEELKEVGRMFTAVMTPIVDTIDCHGLDEKYLCEHKAAAKRFVNGVLERDFASEVAREFQQRVSKYQEKLFSFLGYDGIPWNNNNTENAIKRFWHLGSAIGGGSTAKGMQEYLVLLSICETLRRRGRSFLKFLVSGCTDVYGFIENRGGGK